MNSSNCDLNFNISNSSNVQYANFATIHDLHVKYVVHRIKKVLVRDCKGQTDRL